MLLGVGDCCLGELPYKDGGCSSYHLGVKKAVLISLTVFSLKRSTAGAFLVPLKVLSRTKDITRDCFRIVSSKG